MAHHLVWLLCVTCLAIVLQSCILMNNIQQVRIEVEKMYENLGGAEVSEMISWEFLLSGETHIMNRAA